MTFLNLAVTYYAFMGHTFALRNLINVLTFKNKIMKLKVYLIAATITMTSLFSNVSAQNQKEDKSNITKLQQVEISHDMEDLVTNQRVQKRYAHRVQLINDKLPSYQTIKKFILLPHDFSVDGDELTPTLKLKRKIIHAKYQERIEQLYLNDGNGSDDQPQSENGGDS